MSKIMFRWLASSAFLGLGLGCATVSSISVSQIPAAAARKQRVTASASSPIILGIPFGSSFPDKARDKLLDQCPSGKIEGLLSKHQSTVYFIGVAIDEVVMEGYCIQAQAKG